MIHAPGKMDEDQGYESDMSTCMESFSGDESNRAGVNAKNLETQIETHWL